MRLLSSDGEFALFSVGQFARGVFVLGQFAIGVVVVGQFGVGLVTIGQFAIAPAWGVAMFGLGGRGKLGMVRVLPWWQDRPKEAAPPCVEIAALRAGEREGGWIRARTRGGRVTTEDGEELVGPLLPERVPREERDDVLAHVERVEHVDGGTFREPAERTVTLKLVDLFVPAPPRYVPSAFGAKAIRPPEVALRLVAWLVLTAATLLVILTASLR
jgi:hypothetical protein